MHKEEQGMVQKYVSTLLIYSSVLQAIPAILFTLFAGAWSDLHGRKALIVCSTLGYLISNVVFLINTHFFYELKAEYLLFEVSKDVMALSSRSMHHNCNLPAYLVPARLYRRRSRFGVICNFLKRLELEVQG